MSRVATRWSDYGFANPPQPRVSDGSLRVYRCWGARSPGVGSSEWGRGWFSVEKPVSVLDAELLLDVVDHQNGVNFISTFRLHHGVLYWVGPVAHGPRDLFRAATQIYVEEPLQAKLALVVSKEVLRHDVFVSSADGRA